MNTRLVVLNIPRPADAEERLAALLARGVIRARAKPAVDFLPEPSVYADVDVEVSR